jgi:hypothetical protein
VDTQKVKALIFFVDSSGVQNEKFRDGGLADRNIENRGVPQAGGWPDLKFHRR